MDLFLNYNLLQMNVCYLNLKRCNKMQQKVDLRTYILARL